VAARQELLRDRIRLFNRLAEDAGLPVTSPSESPIRCIGAGVPRVAYRLVARLRSAGYHANTASFPAVPARRSGARLALTAHHTEDDVAGVVAALAEHLPAAMADEGTTVEDLHRAFGPRLRARWTAPRPARLPERPALTLETASSVADLDRAEWDRLLGERGAFDSAALATYEAVFGPAAAGEREHRWDFTYFVVRDRAGRPVAATFLTTALWKDDALSPAPISREVARRREERRDPYFLTSPMVAAGSLLTEGDHLWLDRSADWRGALRLILGAARAIEDAARAAAVVLRDLPDGDRELHEFLLGEGLVPIPVPDTWVREIDMADDSAFLASLTRKRRYHQRTRVLPFESAYRIEVVAGGSPEAAALSAAQRDELYRLYRAVHARAHELAVFPLPRRVIDAVLDSPAWEAVLLHHPDRPSGPAAFSVMHVTPEHVAPVFVGLDYGYVASHGSYQQLLWQAIRSAQRRGARRVLYGMSADLQKSRFGAVREKRWAYVQATDTFNADVLAQLTATVGAA
jgi:hypothetical protein